MKPMQMSRTSSNRSGAAGMLGCTISRQAETHMIFSLPGRVSGVRIGMTTGRVALIRHISLKIYFIVQNLANFIPIAN